MQEKTIPESVSAISRKLALLPSLPIKELKQLWRSLYRSEPPFRVSRELLIRAVAYRIQEQALGGLKPSTRRLLKRLASDARVGKPLTLSSCPPPVSAGTVLMRDWQGITHEVQVLDRGVLYERKRYRSLSEVARLITGSRWSSSVLRPAQQERGGGEPWLKVTTLQNAAQSMPASPPRRASSRISTPCTRNARLARHLSEVRPVRAGAWSGATMDRPALRALLAHVKEKRIDVVMVYKVDRLTRGVVCRRHATVQHHDLDGPAHPQRAALVCPVRTRSDRRTYPRQDRGFQAEGDVDGRHGTARLRHPRSPSCGQHQRGRDGAANLPALTLS